jgi:dipeptidyl aminopeptidase/acylaminoacyl peptidase
MNFRAVCLLACALPQLLSGDVPLIPRAVLFGNPERTNPHISSDGKMLAYLAPDHDVLNVWVRTIGRNDDRPVTADRKRGIRIYFWQPAAASIIYLQDVGGNENFHVFQTDVATKQTRELTPGDKVRAQIVAVDEHHPDFMLVETNQRKSELMDVYRLDFKTGKLTLDTENPGDVSSWSADHAMQVRGAQALLPDGSQEIRLRTAGSAWKSFQKLGPDENFGGIAGFTPDNQSVYLVSSVGANTSRLLLVNPKDGAQSVVAEDSHYDVSDTRFNCKTNQLEAVSFERAKTEWQVIDPAFRDDFDQLQKLHEGVLRISSCDASDQHWVVSYSVDNGPVSFYEYDRAAKKGSFLFANRPLLEKYQLARTQPISFPARDGLTVNGYLTMPVGVEKNAPTVLLVHGGPWGRDGWGFSSLVQMLANRGYAVLQVNFRGSTGYGKQFLNAGDREWAGKMHTDLLDGKKWAIDQGYSDSKRFAIMGGSYGGYATLVGVAFTPDEFTCGVDIVGPSNLYTLLKTIPPYWATIRAMFDKRMGKDEDFLRSRSPLFKADKIKAPLLIGQGKNDPRVNIAESDQIVKAMRDNSKEVEYIVFPDEGHGFARPENNLRFFAATDQFLAKYMGGRAEPPSAEEKWDAFLK